MLFFEVPPPLVVTPRLLGVGGCHMVDPTGPESGTRHVLRGGSWANKAIRLRSARRPWLPPEHPDCYGFRVVLEADDRWGRND
jgi:hypothetical protein